MKGYKSFSSNNIKIVEDENDFNCNNYGVEPPSFYIYGCTFS